MLNKMRIRCLLFFWGITLLPLVALGQYFEEVSGPQGVNHAYGWHTYGGGVSFFDFNQDGKDDLSFATEAGYEVEFYQNTGFGFLKIPLNGISHLGASRHLIWVDFDNDADVDLFLTASDGPNRLYENDGSMNFTDITQSAGFPMISMPSYGACWGDVNLDGWLDVYVTNRVLDEHPFSNYLYLNNGDGTFSDVTLAAGVADSAKGPLAPMFVDLDGDLYPELYLSQDKLYGNTLFHNQGNGTFSDISGISGADVKIDGMGLTIGDYDEDGDFDWYMSNTTAGNILLRQDSALRFSDATLAAGVGLYGTGWGVSFVDVDHDTDLDIYASALYFWTNPEPWSTLFIQQGNGAYEAAVSTSMQGDTALSYSNAVGDFNRDGYPDMAVNNILPYTSFLWKNLGKSNNWLKYRLRGTTSNRMGIGAKVEIYGEGKVQLRFSHCGTSYMGQNSEYEMVGLGPGGQADSVIVRWPSGLVDRYLFPNSNFPQVFEEGSTISSQQATFPEQQALFRLAPNPGRGTSLFLHWQQRQMRGTLRLSTLQGQIRRSWEIRSPEQQTAFEVGDLAAGGYLLHFHSTNGQVFSQKYFHH